MKLFIKNIKYLRAKHSLSQEALSKALEINRSIYKRLELGSDPSPELLVALADFFEVSVDALIRMDIESMDIDRLKQKAESLRELDQLKILTIAVDPQDREYIQFVPEKAKAGYLTGYSDPLFVGQLPSFRLPHLSVGTYRAFEISGDSMPPIHPKSIVIGKYVEHTTQIKNLSTYVVVSREAGVSYKRLINKPKEKRIICLSDNPHYTPYSIAYQEIIELWSYHCHLDFQGQDTPQRHFYKELLDKAEEIEELETLLEKKRKSLPTHD